MTQPKTDPRILRTRKLIMDSFIALSSKKEFKDITIKDITSEAMINRATFYYHFEDIYDLLDKALSEVLFINLNCQTYEDSDLNEETLVNLFKAITDFQLSLSNRCHRGYEDTIARIIRDQLEVIFLRMLERERPKVDIEQLKVPATMLSWGLYGASVEWGRNQSVTPEKYIKSVGPFLQGGLVRS
ncbi:TetR/AcrR family transcriptional regulator [Ornithinibacillus scapharcae]|uniref:TetR/AcrR family transcriptional regulator n=1 Tax=Ornithinibacillus scapharcae TaxID=1147159 RepID=UPI000225B57C|nr:TetR/AcrR family transcriptional regulator [Ornithinibacillus scapharcae]